MIGPSSSIKKSLEYIASHATLDGSDILIILFVALDFFNLGD